MDSTLIVDAGILQTRLYTCMESVSTDLWLENLSDAIKVLWEGDLKSGRVQNFLLTAGY
jgi:hypothetical protein